ncbi:TPA: hypothetical protein ACVGI0_006068 [Pseudomonas aeruginosa]
MSMELNKESVEQAGGDERDLQGAQGERDGWGPFPIVQVPWNVFDRAVMWVEDRRRYGDDGTIVDDWKALKTIQRAALAQPSPKCATCNGTGQIVVSGPHYCGELQPPEYETEPCDMCSQPSPAQADEKPGDSILCYGCFAKGVGPDHFDEAGKCLAAQAEQAEAERPEVVARVVHSNPVVLGQCGPLNANDELMTVAQHAASVARWAEMFNRVEQERDAALVAQAGQVPDILTEDDMKWLRRFAECCEDSDAGGHDLPKAAVKQLVQIGALRHSGPGRQETTAFGDWLLDTTPVQGGFTNE